MSFRLSRINEARVRDMRVGDMRCRRVDADGNCLFRAASVALSGDIDLHEDESAAQLRSDVVAFMHKNRSSFECYVDHFDTYMQKISEENTWGGEPELSAIARLKRRPVHVYKQSGDEYVLYSEYPAGTRAHSNAISLLFDVQHYDALLA
jgi:hypothetical protein